MHMKNKQNAGPNVTWHLREKYCFPKFGRANAPTSCPLRLWSIICKKSWARRSIFYFFYVHVTIDKNIMRNPPTPFCKWVYMPGTGLSARDRHVENRKVVYQQLFPCLAKKEVNFGPQTTKSYRRAYWPYLSARSVYLTEFHSLGSSRIQFSGTFAKWRFCEFDFNCLNCLSRRTCGAGRSHVGFCPIFLVVSYLVPIPLSV